MEIIAISAVVGAVAFGLGIACGKNSPCMHDCRPAEDEWTSRKWLIEAKAKSLEQELEYVKRSCRLHHTPPFLGCEGCHHKQVTFAQTVEQQKIVDTVQKAQETAKKLVKDLSLF